MSDLHLRDVLSSGHSYPQYRLNMLYDHELQVYWSSAVSWLLPGRESPQWLHTRIAMGIDPR
ncbi:MAG: hypothetical protein ACPHWZ_04340 [Longimicrobiales bacterium]